MGEIAINPTHNIHKKYRTMNLVNPYIFAPPVDLSTNTEIGGVAATIGTPALLAAKLTIDVSLISAFSIVGNDIKCNISESYSLKSSVFDGNSSITYYYDMDGRVNEIYTRSFFGCSKLTNLTFTAPYILCGADIVNSCPKLSLVSMPNNTTIQANAFRQYQSIATSYYIPRCTILGGSVLNNLVFDTNVAPLGIIFAHPSLSTNNAGAPDGDLTYAISKGMTVRYVSNFTAPNPITDLSIGTIYGSALQVNFTPPSSTNAIDYYECYVNGIFKNTISASGQYVTGLSTSTSYSIEVKPVDVFLNKSNSNVISQSTNATAPLVPTVGLVSYYKLDGNSNDSFGSNNGVDTSVSYVSGKIGSAGSYNGTTSKNTFNFSSITGTEASISFWVKLTKHTPTIEAKTGIISINSEDFNSHYPYSDGNIYCCFLTNSRKTIGAGIISDRTQWHMVTVTANSISNVWKFYQNGILVTTSTVGSFSLSSIATFGKSRDVYFLDGQLDEIAIYNRALTQTEIELIYNSGNGTTL